jgi:hypothetical protein
MDFWELSMTNLISIADILELLFSPRISKNKIRNKYMRKRFNVRNK